MRVTYCACVDHFYCYYSNIIIIIIVVLIIIIIIITILSYLASPSVTNSKVSSLTLNHLCTPTLNNNVSRISHLPSIHAYMVSIFVRVGICAALFSGTMTRLPPHSLHTVPCNKAEFCIHCRHAVGGGCKQKMSVL